MKVEITKELSDLTDEELCEAYDNACENLRWLDPYGLDHANKVNQCEILRKEAIKRGLTEEEEE